MLKKKKKRSRKKQYKKVLLKDMCTGTEGPTSMQHNEQGKTQPAGFTARFQSPRYKKETLKVSKEGRQVCTFGN